MRIRARRVWSLVTTVLLVFGLGACAQRDNRTVLTVWSWEPSMRSLARGFEARNPDIRIVIKSTSGYENLNTAIEDGYGQPDVVQFEYFALQQYAISGQLRDLTDRAAGYDTTYTPGTWSSVHLNGRVYGLPMDSGPMAFFYNQEVLSEAGVDGSAIHTWKDYYEAAKKLKSIGVYIAADTGEASFYDAMIWLAGGKPFRTSPDGKTVTVDLQHDRGTAQFTRFWQKMIDEGLVDTRHTMWSDGWKNALGRGTVASVFAGAWMPSLLLSDVPGTAGLWRVGRIPTPHGQRANAENGGSALGVLSSSDKPNAAFRFIEYACHEREGIATRVDGGAFPADNETLARSDFLHKATVKDERGIDIPYFGGQEFNRVLSQAANEVSTGYQYLPFEVYARTDFRTTVGKVYQWSTQQQAMLKAKARVEAGQTNPDGSAIAVPDAPGPRISLRNGIALWQSDLMAYGTNQGFTMRQP
ncbi:extracellular solute-binding protein [Bifidobacterium mongoliense]|uniref:extracellular solute-binding protein n=1 Tax=Bifidobacterium mongoliense TaxID=518643 RepID=UPI0030EB1AFE